VKGERWEQVKELFAAALQREPGERSAFLREACGEDDALRSEVESLLSSYREDSFIETPAAESILEITQETQSGQRIGSLPGNP